MLLPGSRGAPGVNRATAHPGEEVFAQSIGGAARQYEISATATSIRDLCERMEAGGNWLRLGKAVWPTMFHAASVTEIEPEQLRRIPSIIRKGRAQRIERAG